jgi:hypothetical protein
MQIKVLKTVIAAANEVGNFSKEYKEGETYEIFDELAQVFINEKWGVLENSEEKAFDETLENKAIQVAPENKFFRKKVKKETEEISENKEIEEEK